MSPVTSLRGRAANHHAVNPARPANRARHLYGQLRLALAALDAGEPRAAQLPHHGDVIGELALEPRGGNEQFRAPGLLAKKACRLRELGGRKRLSKVANRDQVARSHATQPRTASS